MIRKEKDGIHTLEFELYSEFPKLKCVIFLRQGGSSLGKYQSLNLSYNVSDDPLRVKSNELLILSNLNLTSLVRANLCHGKEILEVSRNQDTSHLLSDAIATKELTLGLLVTHADCQAACFYDPIHHAVANVHSGWRGNVQNIYAETVQFMKNTYDSNPADIHVAVAPSLGPSNAEFIHYKNELPQNFWQFEITPNHFDFWQIAKMQLKMSGILDHHIQIASIDTYSNSDDYFSYRRENITGRNATVVALL